MVLIEELSKAQAFLWAEMAEIRQEGDVDLGIGSSVEKVLELPSLPLAEWSKAWHHCVSLFRFCLRFWEAGLCNACWPATRLC